MVVLLIITIGVMTFLNLRNVMETNRQRYLERVNEIVQTVKQANYPMTASVLESMQQLSGARFCLIEQGEMRFQSSKFPGSRLPDISDLPHSEQLDLQHPVTVNGEEYFGARVQPTYRVRGDLSSTVFVLVSRADLRETGNQGLLVPIISSAVIFPIAVILSFAFAATLARPIRKLNHLVAGVAPSDDSMVATGPTRDEVATLSLSVQQMLARLQEHEHSLREQERLETLVKISQGMAHNLRNSTTGCKMAIELIRIGSDPSSLEENLDVADRQLSLINRYVDQFLAAARKHESPEQVEPDSIHPVECLDEVLYLLKPMHEHLGVELKTEVSEKPIVLLAPRDDFEQLLFNLIKNAIEAASSKDRGSTSDRARVRVKVELANNQIQLSVVDNGPGPPSEVKSRLFDAFASGKPEGVGLGLFQVRELVESLHGSVRWFRDSDETTFEVKLPVSETER